MKKVKYLPVILLNCFIGIPIVLLLFVFSNSLIPEVAEIMQNGENGLIEIYGAHKFEYGHYLHEDIWCCRFCIVGVLFLWICNIAVFLIYRKNAAYISPAPSKKFIISVSCVCFVLIMLLIICIFVLKMYV